MRDKATILDHTRFGYDFITGPYLPEGKDEYYLRNQQLGRDNSSYRPLSDEEIAALKKNLNVSPNWADVLVSDPFDPSLVRNTEFYGLVRIGALSTMIVSFHDFAVPVGIANSRIISCDIGDNCAILDCTYLSHYIIADRVILYRIGEMQTTNHAKFGTGIIKEGESEDVLIAIDVVNENAGRSIRPFDGMLASDAFLWSTYREDEALMRAFGAFTDDREDKRRGYYGYVGEQSIIKSCDTIKDVWVGPGAYIKGANKLKNLMLRSTVHEPVQIGEGVELVNGIIGSGSRVFYGVKAIRFIIGDNSNLKYGARLIHSFLGDNCTVSCCELLNNLIYSGHEQHHNNSFLIASLIMGQSNMAAGANIGSNHNSRANDGELIAGRGFWPALSSSLKYDCRFASYVLLDKGNFPHEMNIPIPFCLVTTDEHEGRRLIMPAYWWMYNLYALERNSYKYRVRDKRKTIRQHIEVDYLAPDTANEILVARTLLEEWVGSSFKGEREGSGSLGKRLLTEHRDIVEGLEVFAPGLENSAVPMRVLKAGQAYRAYEEMLIYYAVWAIATYAVTHNTTVSALQGSGGVSLGPWLNLGGQLVPEARVAAMIEAIKEGTVASWDEMHRLYEEWYECYEEDRALHALAILYSLLECDHLDEARWQHLVCQCSAIRHTIDEQVFKSKEKDYHNHFRGLTYRNAEEREAVIGRLDDNPFIAHSKVVTEALLKTLSQVRYQ
ncbi:MAG TPA: DUF4954 family protein [Sphaerochaeta sp.]|nr:DUF4954 family protein [Sphaerochaeta sp.]